MSNECPRCGKPIPEHSAQRLCPACLSNAASISDREASAESEISRSPHGRFEPGTILDGRYRIVSLLGRGGMGEVYRADDLKLRQAVALKMLPQALAHDRRLLEALYNEVRQARRVSHRHVCRVHDVGEAEGQVFLTMEFIEGEDLGALLRRIGRLPQDKALQLGWQLCEGIRAGHEEGVLHLDLKPANLMIDQRGDLRITDFGLAQLAADASRETTCAGTPAYMAPEQLLQGQASPQVDIYAVALILSEMRSGRRAIPGRNVEEIRQFHESSGLPEVPPAFEPILRDCLSADPAVRPQAMAILSGRLSIPDPSTAVAAGKQLAALMFTDIVGSVALQQRLGTEAYMRYVSRHDEILQSCLAHASGAQILNETGDGFLVRFHDPSEAVNVALRIQYGLREVVVEGEPIAVRIGLHLGVVTEMEERIRGEKRAVGMPINLTARIMDLAEGGQILMTRAVYEDARNYVREHPAMAEGESRADLRWVSHGGYLFKGNAEAMEIFEVGVEGVAPLRAPVASGKAMPADTCGGGLDDKPHSKPHSEAPPTEVLDDSDVYLAYSPIDDQALQPATEGWISQFHRNLEIRLQQLAGEPLKVWRGHWTPGDEDRADECVVRRLPSMRAMVSVVSPPFVKSNRCRSEVTAFLNCAASPSPSPERSLRMLQAVKRPVPTSQLEPPLDKVLGDRMGIEFFDRDPETGRVREFDEAFGERARQRYQERIYDLAHEVCSVLQNVVDAESGVQGKRVFLALTTYELQDAYDAIRRVLLEKGHSVFPDQNLPIEAAALEHDVRAGLQECDLAVHLLGGSYGMIPENAHHSAAEIQNRIAEEEARLQGFPRLIWMRRDLDVRDERQAAFLKRIEEEGLTDESVDLVKGTVSLFKEILARRLNPDLDKEEDEHRTADMPAKRIYVMCDRGDEAAVEPLEDYLFEKGLEVFLPDFDADQDAFGQNHRDNLTDCDAVLIYFGKGRKAWVETKLRDALKATGYGRKTPIRHQAVYIAPPDDHRKERYRTHSAKVIRQEGDAFTSSESLDEFIDDILKEEVH